MCSKTKKLKGATTEVDSKGHFSVRIGCLAADEMLNADVIRFSG